MVGRSLVPVGVALLLLLAAAGQPAAAQAPPSCASKLIGCADYLNSTTKPAELCCSPLKDAVANDLKCLCSLLNETELLQSFNINVTQVLQLPKRCGITEGTDVCQSLTANPPASGPNPGSSRGSSPPPPSTGDTSGNTWMGMYAAMSLLIFWWSIATL